MCYPVILTVDNFRYTIIITESEVITITPYEVKRDIALLYFKINLLD